MAPELVVVDSAAARRTVEPRGAAGADPQRRHALGGLQALLRGRTSSPRSSAAARPARRPLVRRRPRVTARRSSTGRSRRCSATLSRCRACVEAGYPLESWPVRAPFHGPARVPLRAGAGGRRGRGAAPVARPRRADAAALAAARRRRALRDLLLRVGDALLPGPAVSADAATGRRRRASRSSAASGATGSSSSLRPELIVTVGGLALRRLLGIARADRRDRQELHARRCDRDPASPPVRGQWLAERRGEPRPARQGADTRAARAGSARRRLRCGSSSRSPVDTAIWSRSCRSSTPPRPRATTSRFPAFTASSGRSPTPASGHSR